METTNMTTINYDSYRQPWTFTLLLVISIPAIICTLVILLFFFSHWYSMIIKALHHHAVFLLIIISFLYTSFDLPISMNYFRLGYHPYRSIPFCLWWYWFDYSLLGMSLLVTAVASIQRHILIFHSRSLQNKKTRWILHYMPLMISVIYPPLFYIILMFLYPCSVYFDENEGWCAYPCYIDNIVLYNIDWLLNNMIPVFIIVIANITLIIRVIYLKKRVHRHQHQQRSRWKRQKKLTFQLLTFSSLYMVVWFPMTIVAVLHALVFPNIYNDVPNLYYIYHLTYFVCPLQSFVCIFALPELMDFMKRKTRRMRITTRATTRAVVPPRLVQAIV